MHEQRRDLILVMENETVAPGNDCARKGAQR